MQKTILITAVHYNNSPEVEKFIDHVFGLSLPDDWHIDIAIADNSRNLTVPPVSRGLSICRPESNLGYLRGCFFALEHWKQEQALLPELVCVSNTDIEFEQDFFKHLSALELPDQVSVIAPDILLRNGTRQNPYRKRRPYRIEMYAYTIIYNSTILVTILDRSKEFIMKFFRKQHVPLQDQSMSTYKEIYASHGSCFFLHRTFLERGGTLNFRGFMFGEEFFIAEQARALGVKTVWVPELRILHDRKKSTGRVAHSQKVGWRRESARILWEDYFSKG